MQTEQQVTTVKITLVGPANSGKTCLLSLGHAATVSLPPHSCQPHSSEAETTLNAHGRLNKFGCDCFIMNKFRQPFP